MKAVGKQDVTDELKVLKTHFKGDYDVDSLTSELQLLPTIFKFGDVKALKSLSPKKRMLVGNCVTVIRIALTAGATFATPGRFFPMLTNVAATKNDTGKAI